MLATAASWPASTVAARAKSTHVQCPPPHRRLIDADAQAVIYLGLFETPEEEVYACAYGSPRRYRLGPPASGSEVGSRGVGPIALSGLIVAYGRGYSLATSGQSDHEIWVRNLVTGKVLYRTPNGSPSGPGSIGLGETVAIVVKRDRAVAWTVRAGIQLGGFQVRSVDKTGGHILAMSTEIEPDSLALAGSTVYWTQGSKTYSAQLQ